MNLVDRFVEAVIVGMASTVVWLEYIDSRMVSAIPIQRVSR